MKTSVPPAYKFELEPTVVQVSKNNIAIKQPSEPKYCCFKARNYILFALIFRILLFIGAVIYDAVIYDDLSLKIIGLIFTASAALGILGVQRRSYAIVAGFLAVDMMTFIYVFITKFIVPTYYIYVPFIEFMDVKTGYAAHLIMVFLGSIFLSPRDELVY